MGIMQAQQDTEEELSEACFGTFAELVRNSREPQAPLYLEPRMGFTCKDGSHWKQSSGTAPVRDVTWDWTVAVDAPHIVTSTGDPRLEMRPDVRLALHYEFPKGASESALVLDVHDDGAAENARYLGHLRDLLGKAGVECRTAK
jgi:hypothetical protein